MNDPKIWNQCLSAISAEVNETEFNTWLRPLVAEMHRDALVLRAPNEHAIQIVRVRFQARIHEIVNSLSGENTDVSLKLFSPNKSKLQFQSSTDNPISKRPNQKKAAKEGLHKYGFGRLDSRFTFDEFIVGASNQLARNVAEAVSSEPGQRAYNPLFIYGKVGNGKTHLMQAIGHSLRKNNSAAQVGYVRSSSFVQHLVTLFKKRDNDLIEKFKSRYRSLDALLIDDVHLFAGANASQEEFFHTFNSLLDGQKQIVITSDRFFKELKGMEDRLTSRIGQGMTVKINPPEFETRVAILEFKAKQKNLVLPHDVSHYLANHIKSSVRELEGAINRLTVSQRFCESEMTVKFVKQKLVDLLESNQQQVDISIVQKEVARFYGIRLSDILSKSRVKRCVKARHVAMALCCQLTNESLINIGEAFGREHTTVMHARNRIQNRIQDNPKDRREYNTLKEKLSP